MCSKDGKKWEDPDFGPTEEDEYGARSLYRDGKMPDPAGTASYPNPEHLAWKRPSYKKISADVENSEEDEDEFDEFDEIDDGGDDETFCEEGELFKGGYQPNDVIQGTLGDCWFLGGLAVLANAKNYLENIFFINCDENKTDSNESSKGVIGNLKWRDAGIWVCRFYRV